MSWTTAVIVVGVAGIYFFIWALSSTAGRADRQIERMRASAESRKSS